MLSKNCDQATTQTGASSSWARGVFFQGARGFTVADVLTAADFRGELTAPLAQFIESRAFEQQAETEGLNPDADAIQTLSEEFRYKQDLISVEEVEAWLAARDLTVEDFDGYCARLYWRAKMSGDIQKEQYSYVTAPAELRESFRVELHFNGLFDQLVRNLAWRAAANSASSGPAPSESLADEHCEFLRRHLLKEENIGIWLDELGCGTEWLEEMLRFEAAFKQERARALTLEARTRTLQTMRLSLVQFTLESMLLPSMAAANEARLCLLEDGFSMAELSIETGCPVAVIKMRLGDLPSEQQPRFLSAVVGTLFDPEPTDEGCQIIRVAAKREPVLEDDEVARKIDEQILERHFQELASRHIRWPRCDDATTL